MGELVFMKKLLKKDNYKRQQLLKKEINHFILKNISNSFIFTPKLRWYAALQLSKKFKINLQSLVNRCIITSRKKRINKLYSFSRIMFLKLVRLGYLTGLKKSTW